MKFATFLISQSLDSSIHAEIRQLISQLPFKMEEIFSSDSTQPSDSSLITIGSASEVIELYNSPRFIVSDIFIREMIQLKIPEFPFRFDSSHQQQHHQQQQQHQHQQQQYQQQQQQRQRISLCLGPLWISCVGYNNQDEVLDMHKKVTLLGGIFSRGFNENVTLVISRTNLSPKSIDARKNGLPIVDKKWLDDCFQHTKRIPLSAEYMLPYFQGITFTSSDLTPEVHHELKKLVIDNGGRWIDIYNDTVTYLIADGLTNTKKIGIALQQSVPIVRPAYVRDPTRFSAINWWALTEEKSNLFKGFTFSIQKKCANIEAMQEAIAAHSGTLGPNPTHIVVNHGFDTKVAKSNNKYSINKGVNNNEINNKNAMNSGNSVNNRNNNTNNAHITGNNINGNSSINCRNSNNSFDNFLNDGNDNNNTCWGILNKNRISDDDNVSCGMCFVTPDWLWACVEHQKVIPTTSSPLFTPLPFTGPIKDVSNVTFFLCASLSDSLRKTVANAVRIAGGIPVFKLTSEAKFAVSEEYTPDLFKLELRNKLPIVSSKFVLQILRTGKLPNPSQFQVDGKLKNDMMSKICKFIKSKSTTSSLLPSSKNYRNESINDNNNVVENGEGSNLMNIDSTNEGSVMMGEERADFDFEKCDLETFTQDLTSTPNEVTLEVKYDSQPGTQQLQLLQKNSNNKKICLMKDYAVLRGGSSSSSQSTKEDPLLTALQISQNSDE